MKKLILLLLVVIAACNKTADNNEPTVFAPRSYALPTAAEAKAQYDNSNYGIYKAVAIAANDSVATFKIDIHNSTGLPFIHYYRNLMLQDSLVRYVQMYVLNPQFDTTTVPENADHYSTEFASHVIGKGPVVGFGVQVHGANPALDVLLFNNSTTRTILKETSTNLIRCFEGTYDGVDCGKIAWLMTSDTLKAVRKSTCNHQFFNDLSGTVTGNSFTITKLDDISGNTFTFNGIVTGNTCNGTWTSSATPSVVNTFSAVRTL